MAQQPQAGQDVLIVEDSDRTQTHHIRQDFSGRVINRTQGLVPDNKQHSKETDIHAPGGIVTPSPCKLAATGIDSKYFE
jgi:hypothetical protein